MRLKWFVIPAFALGLGACKKEAPAGKSETPATAVAPGQPAPVEAAPEKPAEPAKPAVSVEQRAAKLGFAKYLPKNVESLISVHNASKSADRAKSLKLWKFVEEQMGEEVAVAEPAEEPAVEAADAAMDAVAAAPAEGPAETTEATDPVPVAPATEPAIGAAEGGVEAVPAVPGEAVEEAPAAGSEMTELWKNEITIALGDTSGEQIGHVLNLSGRFNYFQFRQLTKMMIAQAKSTEGGGMTETPSPFDEQMIADMINDPEGGINVIEKLALPPLYFAFKVDPAKREAAAQEITSSLGMIGALGEAVEPVEVEKAGTKFTGYKILGAKVAEQIASGREDMEKTIEPEIVDRLLAALAKKDIVIISGSIGDYVFLFLGGSADQFDLVSDPKDSLLSGDALKFGDDYLSKDLAAVLYGEKDSLQTLVDSAGGVSDMAMGIRDGLAGQDGLGETREIESLLQVVVEREAVLRKLASVADMGAVAFYEEGLKIESFGGTDQGSLDWKASNKLGHLGDPADVVLFANATIDPAYDKAAHEFLQSLFETGYAISRKVSELPAGNEDLTKFKEMTKLFDEKFRVDVVALWEAFSGDFAQGLGQESALVVDLKGSVPTIPGIPQAVVDQGRFPRVSWIAPVEDRSKLASSWDKMNKSGTSILAKVSEMSGTEIPMQKPISSEKNGLTTWFFSMPFFNDDFLPSVTVGDQWFVASTSKNQAVDLAAQAGKGAEGKKGLALKLNFVALQNYSKEMLKVVDANSEAIFGEDIEQYRSNKESIEKAIATFDDFDSMTVYSNRDSGVLRTSIHFKTR